MDNITFPFKFRNMPLDINKYEIIPVGGMILSNSIVAIGLCYKQQLSNFKNRRDKVQTKLALGAVIFFINIFLMRENN